MRKGVKPMFKDQFKDNTMYHNIRAISTIKAI
jgi:hypothetical protein